MKENEHGAALRQPRAGFLGLFLVVSLSDCHPDCLGAWFCLDPKDQSNKRNQTNDRNQQGHQ
jgi:hypothetical protein